MTNKQNNNKKGGVDFLAAGVVVFVVIVTGSLAIAGALAGDAAMGILGFICGYVIARKFNKPRKEISK